MSTHSVPETIVVEIPMVMRIEVAFPDGEPRQRELAAQQLAVSAAKSLAHVSAAQISAFNEVNRLHPSGLGEVRSVDSVTAD